MAKPKVLIIYTGGTIGMIRDEKKGTLKPFRLSRMTKSIPSILELGIEIHAMELEKIVPRIGGNRGTKSHIVGRRCLVAMIGCPINQTTNEESS